MSGLSARAKVEALIDELGESWNEAVGSLLDMGEITQAQADQLYQVEERHPAVRALDGIAAKWENYRDQQEPIHGDDLPVPDEYQGEAPMPGDRW
jgi:hypothetical protein